MYVETDFMILQPKKKWRLLLFQFPVSLVEKYSNNTEPMNLDTNLNVVI